jgi:tetratricopeptide (TPR) repeat protein/tRNA A-37 threonylcarbamoyl transferase component Bud32
MSCPSEETLIEGVGGQLDASRAGALEAHAADCERCRHALVELASHTALSPANAALIPKPLPDGAQIGRYRVLELVGEGAMGRVYAAWDPVLDRRVALKLIHPRLAGNSELARTRLLREAQSLARVSHPNLVGVHDAGALDEAVFIAMEFIDGLTLRAWLAERERTTAQILEAFVQAGRGLAAAHAAGLVHRDFKPENVLVGKDGRVRVSDFGLARGEEREPGPTSADPLVSAAGALIGTPAYMAPEQLAGEAANARSDQFAFCIALFEALGPGRPFARNTAEAVARGMPALKAPSRIVRALEQGLRARPEQRFPSLEALLRALQPPRQLRRKIALVTTAVAALALTAGWTFGRQRPAALCDGGAARLATVWSPQREGELAQHFDALHGKRTWDGLQTLLEQHVASWLSMHREACEATRVKGEQPDAVLAVRMECLDRRLMEIEALTAVLATTDAERLATAGQAGGALTPIAICANHAALLQPDRLPDNPAQAERAKQVQRVLAKSRALREAGRFKEGLAMATTAAVDARALGHLPTEAQALLVRGVLQESDGDAAASEGTLRDAYLKASGSHDDRTLTLAAIELSFVVGQRLSRLDEGTQWAWLASAGMRRVGADFELEAKLANQEGHLLYDRADFAGAEAKYRQTFELRRTAQGDTHPATAAMLANVARAVMAQGHFDEALLLSRKATALLAAALGEDHPKVAQAHNGIASTLLNLGRNEEALVEVEGALKITVSSLGEGHAEVARYRLNRAVALQRLGRFDEAIADGQSALAALRAVKMEFLAAEALLTLGETLGAAGRLDEALVRLDESRAAYAKTVGDGHEQVSVALEVKGDLLLEHGRSADALEAYQQALSRREKVRGADHPENAFALSGIGRAQAQLGKRALAIPPLRRAAKLLEESGLDADLLAATQAVLNSQDLSGG